MLCNKGEFYDIYFREFDEKVLFANIKFRDFGGFKDFRELKLSPIRQIGEKKN